MTRNVGGCARWFVAVLLMGISVNCANCDESVCCKSGSSYSWTDGNRCVLGGGEVRDDLECSVICCEKGSSYSKLPRGQCTDDGGSIAQDNACNGSGVSSSSLTGSSSVGATSGVAGSSSAGASSGPVASSGEPASSGPVASSGTPASSGSTASSGKTCKPTDQGVTFQPNPCDWEDGDELGGWVSVVCLNQPDFDTCYNNHVAENTTYADGTVLCGGTPSCCIKIVCP